MCHVLLRYAQLCIPGGLGRPPAAVFAAAGQQGPTERPVKYQPPPKRPLGNVRSPGRWRTHWCSPTRHCERWRLAVVNGGRYGGGLAAGWLRW